MEEKIRRERFAVPSTTAPACSYIIDIINGDISNSMHEEGFEPGLSKLALMGAATREFITIKASARPQDYLALVAYEDGATLCCDPLNVGKQQRELLAAVDRMEGLSSGGTKLASALEISVEVVRNILAATHDLDTVNDVLIRCLAYSDGEDQSKRRSHQLADELKGLGVLIETFGVASDRRGVDEKFLQRVASSTNGVPHYRFLGDGAEVRALYQHVALGGLVIEDEPS